MQAAAIAQVAEQTGVQSVDHRLRRRRLRAPVRRGASPPSSASVSIDVVESVGFASGDDDLDDEVGPVLDSDAERRHPAREQQRRHPFLEALERVLDSAQIPNVIVNDALRSSESAQRLAGLRTDVREKILGVAPAGRIRRPRRRRSIPPARSRRTRSTA